VTVHTGESDLRKLFGVAILAATHGRISALLSPTSPPPPTRRYVVRPGVRRRPWLPVAEAREATARLADARGAAVWPACDEGDRAALRAVATLFGAELRAAPAGPALGRAAASGAVVGIGDCADEARLYAHLTGRGWRMVPSTAELERPLPDVVLLAAPALDAHLVQELLREPAAPHVTGIIWGRTRAELRRRALVSSAARALDGPVRQRRTDVSLSMTGGVRRLRDLEVLGPRASADALRRAVTQGSGVLTLFLHGDGVSMSLSPELALCSRLEPSAADDPRLAPACVVTGRCSTLRMDVEEAFAGHVVGPGDVAARVLVMPTCYGAFVGTPACDASWGLLPRLLANPRIGAVVTPVEPSILAADLVAELLSAPLGRGVPVGQALTAYEREPAIASLGHRMLLFGDPDVRAAPRPGEADGAGARPRRPRVVRRAARAGDHGDLAVLGLVAGSLRDGGDGARTAAEAEAALASYREAPGERTGRAMRATLLAHVRTMKGRPYGPWLAAATLRRRAEHDACPGCAWPVRPFDALVRGVARRLVTCPRCGVVADWPAGAELRIAAAPPRVELHLEPRWADDWSAAVYLVPASARDTQMHAWPRTAAGAPERALSVDRSHWPAGPVEVRAVAIVGTSLLAAGTRTRADVALDRERPVAGPLPTSRPPRPGL
jgi:hypothetical protein